MGFSGPLERENFILGRPDNLVITVIEQCCNGRNPGKTPFLLDIHTSITYFHIFLFFGWRNMVDCCLLKMVVSHIFFIIGLSCVLGFHRIDEISLYTSTKTENVFKIDE